MLTKILIFRTQEQHHDLFYTISFPYQHIKVELSGCDSLTLFIPKGCAHGFKSLVDDTITVYNVDSVYNMKYDSGIHFESFGFDWETEDPIISEKDAQLLDMKELLLRNSFQIK